MIIRMMRYRHFLVLVVISFLIAIVHKFFFVWNGPFLRDILDSGGWAGAAEQRISSVGQLFEVLVMTVLGFAIARFGFKVTLLIGAMGLRGAMRTVRGGVCGRHVVRRQALARIHRPGVARPVLWLLPGGSIHLR